MMVKKKISQDFLIARYQKAKRDLENGTCDHRNCNQCPESKEVIEGWRGFMKLKLVEQDFIRKQWEEYYQAVRQTVIYQLVFEQKKALQERNHVRVRELGTEAQSMRREGLVPEVQRPEGIDSEEFAGGIWVKAYLDVDAALKRLAEYVPDNSRTQGWE